MKYSSSYSLLTNCLSALAPKKGDQRERGVTHQGLSNTILMGGKTDTLITFLLLVPIIVITFIVLPSVYYEETRPVVTLSSVSSYFILT